MDTEFRQSTRRHNGRACQVHKYPQTAADMNNILDALGQRDMSYWGFSCGTLLGQTHAGLYPARAKRVIIDGVVNQWQLYEGHYEEESMVDTDTVLDGFFDDCIKVGPTNCPLSSLATSEEELRDTVLSFMVKLRDQPIGVYINNTVHGLLNHDMPTAPASKFRPIIRTHIPKRRPQRSKALARRLSSTPEQSHTLAKRKSVHNGLKTHLYVPRKGVKTAHPLLILSTSYVPVSQLVSARSANEAFVGSQIVEVRGYAHCSVAAASVCLARHCVIDAPYFVQPDGNGLVSAQREFEDSEDEKIHLSQLEMAKDWEFAWPFLGQPCFRCGS
ncbi:hypothetical protein N7499_007770 [Penicillium canescens]|uniref:AB hydrolase-1 domain-containing protein n=1 Tax=Penicillium canescens TaxID=5083 RepID=A0AAD6HXT7_PENCN|nr:uncharacterized protein N7446_012807 [Penicillium canescens]KAJ6022455.1 hypothetical protein N7460_012850 [Penicillium canescens]KAJ6026286.1 hypothetical protein N7444_013965 [Penicillium canescens]KAJ6041741.1 hypothetical protein N7446_012807 [Penicillium canescens]KAJ6075789.1 hypothetical protein N7499_007770 [Penicillium canescens]KAJ6158101.1 hypothetical protein N7485_010927 [Penicillium canescens]